MLRSSARAGFCFLSVAATYFVSAIPAEAANSALASASNFATETGSVETLSGAVTSTVAFALERARGDVQPTLALRYSSRNRALHAGGVGWVLSLPKIEIQNLDGPPRYRAGQDRAGSHQDLHDATWRGLSGPGSTRLRGKATRD